jgi:type I restriction enzyme S subunit
LKLDEVNYISQEKFDSLGGGKLCRGDIVITLRGTLASCAIFDSTFDTGFINAQLMIIRPSKILNKKFMHALLTSPPMYRYFQSLSRGAAVPQITGAQMKEVSVIMPPLKLQNQFIGIIEKALLLIEKSHTQTDACLFESLSQKAFSGEL